MRSLRQFSIFDVHDAANVRAVHRRRAGNRDTLRELLSDGEWHTNGELIEKCGPRFGARLLELRRGVGDGGAEKTVHVVQTGVGAYRYRLDEGGAVDPDCHGPCCLGREPKGGAQ